MIRLFLGMIILLCCSLVGSGQVIKPSWSKTATDEKSGIKLVGQLGETTVLIDDDKNAHMIKVTVMIHLDDNTDLEESFSILTRHNHLIKSAPVWIIIKSQPCLEDTQPCLTGQSLPAKNLRELCELDDVKYLFSTVPNRAMRRLLIFMFGKPAEQQYASAGGENHLRHFFMLI